MSIDLSIIIPAYNVEKYIVECVDSIKIVDNINYEILIINDGSIDNTLNLLENLKKENPKVRYFSQNNKGLGGARNTGIENAKGKYLIFLDADDILVEQHYFFLKNHNFDILELSAETVTVEGKVLKRLYRKNTNLMTGLNYYANFPFASSACNKIYRLDFLREINLKFAEKLYCEDIYFNAKAFLYAKNVKSLDCLLQKFVQTPNSITRNKDSKQKDSLVVDLIFIFNDLREIYFSSTDLEKKVYLERVLGDLSLGIIRLGLIQNISILNLVLFFRKYNLKRYDYGISKNIFKYLVDSNFLLKTTKFIYRIIK